MPEVNPKPKGLYLTMAFHSHLIFVFVCNFSSFFFSLFQIVKDRVLPHLARSAYVWNSVPGALSILPEYSENLAQYPFFNVPLGR